MIIERWPLLGRLRTYASFVRVGHSVFALPFALVGFFIATTTQSAGFQWQKLLLVLLCIAAPFTFFHRRRHSLVLLQILAYGAAITWLTAAWQLVQARLSAGQDWTLAAAILGAVALYTLLAGLLLNSRAMRERYPQ